MLHLLLSYFDPQVEPNLNNVKNYELEIDLKIAYIQNLALASF